MNQRRPLPQSPSPYRHRAILPRFRDAAAGLIQAYREEPNLRFHLFAATGAVLVGYGVQVEGWEVAYLGTAIMAVLFAELVNTAVERTVDLAVGEQRHPLAAQAKEVAAGAVLLTATHAFLAALYLFAVRRSLLGTITAVLGTLRTAPWLWALPVIVGALGLFGAGKTKR